VKPYVGAGLGAANIDVDVDDDTVFAWQLMAGLGYVPQSIPFTEWTLGYRFFNTNDAKITVGATNADMEYMSHNVEAGVKFLF
jgi:opacity protein-like surface antigen